MAVPTTQVPEPIELEPIDVEEDRQQYTGNEYLELQGGAQSQDWETGAYQQASDGRNIEKMSSLQNYTNNLFGAPFQLLPSVDGRHANINPNVGAEYLRNFLLNSPILHIRPGLPKYTGGDDNTDIFTLAKQVYAHLESGETESLWGALLLQATKGTLFRAGKKYQRRMFGFRETYSEYMSYVNYMCRVVASIMDFDADPTLPDGAFVKTSKTSAPSMVPFKTFRWENYRMSGEYVPEPLEQAGDLSMATVGLGPPETSEADVLKSMQNGTYSEEELKQAEEQFQTTGKMSGYDVVDNKIKSVLFMVEPVSFNESLSNETSPSLIEGMIDGITSDIGSEIAFITNSTVDTGILGSLTSFLGSTVESASMSLSGLVSPVTGGFINNLFTGAVQSIKGQKMIYPDIYRSSKSSMDYDFSITLTSPYGDNYNYYMNIVVPLLHLVALASPRMVTANTISSPFLVQSYVPGMCTCQLGIIRNMTITKNPSGRHVSVNGFPLTVKVTFTIQELYNAMSISPANDPASFMFNETLNDYLANMAGLIPSQHTSAKFLQSAFESVDQYFGEEIVNSFGQMIEQPLEDFNSIN